MLHYLLLRVPNVEEILTMLKKVEAVNPKKFILCVLATIFSGMIFAAVVSIITAISMITSFES